MAIKKALITKERYEEELLKIPGVIGVGVSYVDNKPVIVVFVRELKPEVLRQIPARIEGIEVIVKQTEMPTVAALLETKPVLPVAAEASRTARWRPVPGGVSIGHPKITAGTFTCKVYDRETGEPLGLSNNHVIALRWGSLQVGNKGDPILQPGPYDGGTVDRDTIGYLERWEEVRLDKPNLIDAAVFKPKTKDILRDDVLDIGPPQHVVEPVPGMIVRKSGRTCGLMANMIVAVGVTVRVMGWGIATFRDQIWTAGPFIFPGDSGSIVTTEDGHVVGVAFAATPFTGEGIVCKAVHIERLLNISFAKTGKQILKPEVISIPLGVLGGVTAGMLKALAERKKLYSPEEVVYM